MATAKNWETGGNQAIGSGTSVQITSSTTNTQRGMVLKAASDNTGSIWVGETGVSTTTGFELSAGEQVVLPVLIASEVFAISSSGTQSASFLII